MTEPLEGRCLLAAGAEWLATCPVVPTDVSSASEFRDPQVQTEMARATLDSDRTASPTWMDVSRVVHGSSGPLFVLSGGSGPEEDAVPKTAPASSNVAPITITLISWNTHAAQAIPPLMGIAPPSHGSAKQPPDVSPTTGVTQGLTEALGAPGNTNMRGNYAAPALRDVASAVASVLSDAYQRSARDTLVAGANVSAAVAASVVDARFLAIPPTASQSETPAPSASPIARTELSLSAGAYGDLDAGMVDLRAAPNAPTEVDAAHDLGVLTDAERNALVESAPAARTADGGRDASLPALEATPRSLEGGMIALALAQARELPDCAPRSESDGAVAMREMQASLGVYQAFEQGEDPHDTAFAALFSGSETHGDATATVAPPPSGDLKTAAEHSYPRAFVNTLLGLALVEFFRRRRRGQADAAQLN